MNQHNNSATDDEILWRDIWQLLLSLVAVIERHKVKKRFTTKEARDIARRHWSEKH